MSNYHQLCVSEATSPDQITVARGVRGSEPRVCLRIDTIPTQQELPPHILEQGWISLSDEAAQQLLSQLSFVLDSSRKK
jgi:hypothetical protein